MVQKAQLMRGRLTGRTGPSERPGVGSIPAPATCKRKSSDRDQLASVPLGARGPVSKTDAGQTVVGSSPTASARIVPWSSGNDTWPTSKKWRFNSVRDYSRPDTQTGKAARLGHRRAAMVAGRLQLRFLLGALEITIRPRRAARSARHPVTVENVGSNPIGDALAARHANWQSGEAQTFADCGFDSHPCYYKTRRLGIGKPQWL